MVREKNKTLELNNEECLNSRLETDVKKKLKD